MSDTNNTYTEIKVPQLTDSKYGENLEAQFNNINSNFTKLGSGAFTKGDKGDSVNAYRLDITDKVKETYKDDYKKGIIAQAIYMGLDQDGLGPMPISKDTKIEVSVIINDIENSILKSFWSLYVADQTPWSASKNLLSAVENILIDIMPFFYIDKNFYSENLNLPKDKKDKTGIYTFENISARPELRILFTQNRIQQSIYYDNSKGTWCWSLGDNETGIPIYKQTIDNQLLVPWGKDNTYHALYNTTGMDYSDTGRPNSLAISPCKQNPDGTWSVIDLPTYPGEPTNPKNYPELKLDGYYLVHCRRLEGFEGYLEKLSSHKFNTNTITISKTNATDGNITVGGNITANGDIIVNTGTIRNNEGSIQSRNIWGDNVRCNLIEVKAGGTVNITENATLNINKNAILKVDGNGALNVNGRINFNDNVYVNNDLEIRNDLTVNRIISMPILQSQAEDLGAFLTQVNNRLNALEAKK